MTADRSQKVAQSAVVIYHLVSMLQKKKNEELETRIEALLNERDVLKGRVQQLKVSLAWNLCRATVQGVSSDKPGPCLLGTSRHGHG